MPKVPVGLFPEPDASVVGDVLHTSSDDTFLGLACGKSHLDYHLHRHTSKANNRFSSIQANRFFVFQ